MEFKNEIYFDKFGFYFHFRASIIEKFEKAKDKFDDWRDVKMPEISIETLRKQRKEFLEKQNAKKMLYHNNDSLEVNQSPDTDKMASSAL